MFIVWPCPEHASRRLRGGQFQSSETWYRQTDVSYTGNFEPSVDNTLTLSEFREEGKIGNWPIVGKMFLVKRFFDQGGVDKDRLTILVKPKQKGIFFQQRVL